MPNQFLQAGRIVGTHGIKGEMRVDPWCDSADFLSKFKNLYFDEGNQKLEVISSRIHKSQLLLKINEVDTVEKADVFRGKILYIKRDDVKLEDGRYFIEDLIGLDVFDSDTCVYYGKITDIMRTGANDVYQITSETKKNYLIPAVPQVITNININNGKMLIRPIRGIFDDED